MSDVALHVIMVSRVVHPAHGPGGMERKVFDLATRLAQSGVVVELFTETPAKVVGIGMFSPGKYWMAALPDEAAATVRPRMVRTSTRSRTKEALCIANQNLK